MILGLYHSKEQADDKQADSIDVSPFPAGDHKAHINRRSQRHSKHKTEKHKRSTKEVPPWNVQ